jgi:hypothetical protein
MTCLIGDGLPSCVGTTCCWAPLSRTSSLSVKPLLAITLSVSGRSCAPVRGASMIESVPLNIEPMYWLGGLSGSFVGTGPPGFGPAPRPFALAT